MTVLLQLIAKPGGAPVLPDDGVVDRFTCFPVPDDGCFALVGDTDGFDIGAVDTHFLCCFCGFAGLCCLFFAWVVLYPARMREYLCELLLGDRPDLPLMIKNNSARTGSALIEGQDILFHYGSIDNWFIKLTDKYQDCNRYLPASSVKEATCSFCHVASRPNSSAISLAVSGAAAMAARACKNSGRNLRANTSSTVLAISLRTAQITSASR